MLSNFSTCKSPAVAEMGDSLATIDMNKKVEAAVPLSMGKLGPHVTNVAWAEAYLRTKWHLDLSTCHYTAPFIHYKSVFVYWCVTR